MNTEFKGTSGNWRFTYFNTNKLAVLENEQGIEICNFGNDADYYPTEGTEPCKYDAQLIATAPELLEALIDLVKSNPLHNGYHDKIIKADKVIKKALNP